MKRYFNRKTIFIIAVSLLLSLAYSYLFGYSVYNLINGLTLLTCVNGLAALIVLSRSKGDFAMFSFNRRGGSSYNEYRSEIVRKSTGKDNPFFGAFILILVITIAMNYIF